MDNQDQDKKKKGTIDSINDFYSRSRQIWQTGKQIRLILSGARVTALVSGTPVGWIAAGIGIAILLIVIIIFFFGGSTGLSFNLDDSQDSNLPGGPGSQTTPGLNYYIPFRDSSVVPLDLKDYYANLYPNSQISNWDLIINESKTSGWNPAFILTLWIEETHAQTPPYGDALGCDPDHPTTDINVSLQCVFGSFGSLTNDRFDDFMCRYGGDNFSDAPCTFAIHNPNFPTNVRDIYSRLVPSGPGALVQITPPPGQISSASCPIPGGTINTVTCGSKFTPRANCGHCDLNYPAPNLCTYEEINYAEDIGGPSGQDVLLPSIDGAIIDWTLVREGVGSSRLGTIRYYRGENTESGRLYWLQLHHVDRGYGALTGRSGNTGGRICTTSSSCNHVHIEFATIDSGGRVPQDAPLYFCL